MLSGFDRGRRLFEPAQPLRDGCCGRLLTGAVSRLPQRVELRRALVRNLGRAPESVLIPAGRARFLARGRAALPAARKAAYGPGRPGLRLLLPTNLRRGSRTEAGYTENRKDGWNIGHHAISDAAAKVPLCPPRCGPTRLGIRGNHGIAGGNGQSERRPSPEAPEEWRRGQDSVGKARRCPALSLRQ